MMMRFISSQPLMDLDDGLDIPNSAEEQGAEETELADQSNEQGAEEQEIAEPAESKRTSDEAFSDMRRRLEEAEKRNAEFEKLQNEWKSKEQEYEDALGLYFEGEHKIEQAYANANDIPLEKVIDDMKQKKEIASLKSELEQFKNERDRLDFDNRRAQDLAEIKAVFPDTSIKDVLELGEEYFQLRAMGIPPATVYKGFEMKKGNPPKPIGKVKTAVPEKDSFTKEEVEAMSPTEISKNFEKIRKAMSNW